MRHDTRAVSGHLNGRASTGSVHVEGAFLFGGTAISAITESLTGQALSLIYTPTLADDLGESGLVLLDWLIDDENWRYPPDNEIEGDLKGIEADLSSAKVAFRLHDLGEQYEHANGWIVQPYLELIVIDLAASRLRLVAAGTD